MLDKIEKLSQELEKRKVKEKLNRLMEIYMQKTAEVEIEHGKEPDLVGIAINKIIAPAEHEKTSSLLGAGALGALAFGGYKGISRLKRVVQNRAAHRYLNTIIGKMKGVPIKKVKGNIVYNFKGHQPQEVDLITQNMKRLEEHLPHLSSGGQSSAAQILKAFRNTAGEGGKVKGLFEGPLTAGRAAGLVGGGLIAANLLPNSMSPGNLLKKKQDPGVNVYPPYGGMR